MSEEWVVFTTNDTSHTKLSLSICGREGRKTVKPNVRGYQSLVVVYGMDPQVGQFLDGHSFSLCSIICPCNSFHGYPVPLSKKDWSIHTLVFLLLEFHVFCKLYLGYSKFLSQYPLISECISCVFCCDWVTSLRMLSSRSIHLPKNL